VGSVNVIHTVSTCWQDNQLDLRPEIVLISICAVKNNKIKKFRNIFVKPEFGFVSTYCKGKTGLSQKDVYLGLKLKDALSILEEDYSFSKKRLVVWTRSTLDNIKRDCFTKRVKHKLPSDIIKIGKNFDEPSDAKKLAEFFIK